MNDYQGGGGQLGIHTLKELGEVAGNGDIQIVDDPEYPCGRASCEDCEHELMCAHADSKKR